MVFLWWVAPSRARVVIKSHKFDIMFYTIQNTAIYFKTYQNYLGDPQISKIKILIYQPAVDYAEKPDDPNQCTQLQ